jgi:preprotein translocase subunit SecF
MQEQKINRNFYDKYYKLLLLIPAVLLIFSFFYLANFYSNNNDFTYKDISLTGGTSATIFGKIDSTKLNQDLDLKLEDLNTREIFDLITNEKKAVIVETKSSSEKTKEVLEEFLGYELTTENSSFEFTGSTLSKGFYKQLLIAIWVAFILMGLVVFIIFGKSKIIKSYTTILSLFIVKIAYMNVSIINSLAVFLLSLSIPFIFYFSIKHKKNYSIPLILSIFSLIIIGFPKLYINFSQIFMIIISIILAVIYFIYSIPSFAVILSAFADILMTLILIDILGIKLSSAGIIAFLMLIGYSVDTDILLTTRMLKRSGGTLNKRMLEAFKTGMTMTLTSLLAVCVAFFIVKSFSIVLSQIFLILSIGLFFDIFNTWITNASILKWYVEKEK